MESGTHIAIDTANLIISEKNSIFEASLLNNPLIIITIIGSILLQMTVIKIPILSKFLKIRNISPNVIIISFIFSCIIILISEIYKIIYRKINK